MYATERNARRMSGLGDFLGDDFSGSDAAALDPTYYASSDSTPTLSLDSPTVSTVSTTGGSSSGFSFDSLLGDATKILGAGASIYQQKTLLDVNAQRLKAGLAPISASAIAPQVNVGLSPDTQNLVLYGGAALLLLLLVSGGGHGK